MSFSQPKSVTVPAENLSVSRTRQICAVALRNRLLLWDLLDPDAPGRKINYSWRWVTGMVQLEFNPHARLAENLVASSSNELLLWDADSCKLIQKWRLQTRPLSGVSWSSSDPHTLATCSGDKVLHIVDVRQPKPIVLLSAATGASQVKWNPAQGEKLASAHDGNVKIWDTRMAKASMHYTAHTSKIESLDWSHDDSDEFITSAPSENVVKLWSLDNSRENLRTLRVEHVARALYTPFGRGIVTSVKPSRKLEKGAGQTLIWSIDDMVKNTSPEPVATFSGTTFDWWMDSDGAHKLVTWDSTKLCVIPHEIDSATLATLHAYEEEDSAIPAASIEEESKGVTEFTVGSIEARGGKDITMADIGRRPLDLAQEFQNLRSNKIPGLSILELNEGERTCKVEVIILPKANRGSITGQNMTIGITFPSLYPHRAPPSFHFHTGPATMLQNKVKEELSALAGNYVGNNHNCLKPCLTLLVEMLSKELDCETPSNEPENSKDHKNIPEITLVERAAMGAATFSGNGRLISFSNSKLVFNTWIAQAEVELNKNKQTEGLKKSAAINPPKHRSGPLSRLFSKPGKRQQAESVLDTNTKKQPVSLKMADIGRSEPQDSPINFSRKDFVIRSFNMCRYIPFHKELGNLFCDTEPNAICSSASNIAKGIGRPDLQSVWNILEQVFDTRLIQRANNTKGLLRMGFYPIPWHAHPFGGGLYKQILMRYLSMKDIQSVAMMTQILTSFYSRNGKALNDQHPHVDPMHKIFSLEEIRTCALYLSAYSSVLLHFDLFLQAAEARKAAEELMTSLNIEESKTIEQPQPQNVAPVCSYCMEREGVCQCNRPILCTICRRRVNGVGVYCEHCRHGGHSACMDLWMKHSPMCPTGCGCRCGC
eukprot:m.343679 g.343679  ORF g.343679 m.343679 type:complete len:882 (+) comp23128_c0_seq1:228-2873(+)